MTEDYRDDIEINLSQLDVEWVRQPGLFMVYSERLADAECAANRSHERLKVIRSELVREAKETLTKPTGVDIEAYYRANKKHQDAKKDFIDAEHERDILAGAVGALRQKRAALENLVGLHTASYFAGPKDPKNLDESFALTAERVEMRKKVKPSVEVGKKTRKRT